MSDTWYENGAMRNCGRSDNGCTRLGYRTSILASSNDALAGVAVICTQQLNDSAVGVTILDLPPDQKVDYQALLSCPALQK